MRNLIQKTAIGVMCCAFAQSPAVAGWINPCTTAHLIAAWRQQGFWSTAAISDPPSSPAGHEVRYVGKIYVGNRAYKIYFDDNTQPTGAHRADENVIVTTNIGKFLGHYAISGSDMEPVRTEGADILFELRRDGVSLQQKDSSRFRVHFGLSGPPRNIYLNGALPEFTPAYAGAPHNPVRFGAYCRVR